MYTNVHVVVSDSRVTGLTSDSVRDEWAYVVGWCGGVCCWSRA